MSIDTVVRFHYELVIIKRDKNADKQNSIRKDGKVIKYAEQYIDKLTDFTIFDDKK